MIGSSFPSARSSTILRSMRGSGPDYQQFFAELKRRHVFRVMAIYGAVGFVVLQLAELLGQGLRLPEFFLPLVTALVLIGFPLAVVLAWALEQTPDGLKRTGPASPAELDAIVAQSAARRLPAGLLALAGVAALVLGAWWVGRRTAPEADKLAERDGLIRSLAVLPLDNLTGDESQAYFVDGMHDALISELARIEGLTVLSRTSTLRYRETDLSLGQIASELGAEGLVEGSVFQAGDTVRITVQLVRGSPEEHLWTDSYLGDLSNALSLHGRVARSIADEIRLALSPEAEARLAEEHDVDPRAQDAYLQGRALWRTRRLGDLERAVALMEEAVALDPDFASGYAGLADAYLMHAGYAGVSSDSMREAHSRTRDAALQALRLDPELPEPHATLGVVAFRQDFDWGEAESQIRQSLELNPNYAQGWDWLADMLLAQGRGSEAVEAMRRAVGLDPFSPLMHRDLGVKLVMDRDCEQAVSHLERAVELDSEHSLAWSLLQQCSLREGDEDEALEHLVRAGISPEAERAVREAYQTSGWEGVDRMILDYEFSPLSRAQALIRLGRHDEAVAVLRTGYEDRTVPVIQSMKTNPLFDPLRGREDFQAILADMGLAD